MVLTISAIAAIVSGLNIVGGLTILGCAMRRDEKAEKKKKERNAYNSEEADKAFLDVIARDPYL